MLLMTVTLLASKNSAFCENTQQQNDTRRMPVEKAMQMMCFSHDKGIPLTTSCTRILVYSM